MTLDLEYNSDRPSLIIPEYGRHIQKLVDYCTALEDTENRNRMAQAIVDVMGNLQPHLRDVPDFKHKLWDQLFMMSDFKLKVDSPYQVVSKEELQEKPMPLAYPKAVSKYRFYGVNIQTMINTAVTWEESRKRDALVWVIATHMKKCYLNWNKDTVDDSVIFSHLFELSKGKLDLRNTKEKLIDSQELLRKKTGQGKSKNLKAKPSNIKYRKK